MLELTGQSLTLADVAAVARHDQPVAPLSDAVRARMAASQAWVAASVESDAEVIYGVNTGFGPLANKRIAADQARTLSRNVILACVVGVGPPLPREVVRAMMLVRANTLAKGYSGARPEVAQTLIDMLNAGVTPYVPSKGSLGASGDLAPLAHIAAVLTRDTEGDGGYSGQAWHKGSLRTGAQAMAQAGIERLVPEAKEGLALTNGTTFMAAAAALALHDAESLLRHAAAAAALSIEALLGLSEAFRAELHEANGQPGQVAVAAALRALLAGSGLVDSMPGRVQDAYSLRCTPQVLGPVRDTLAFLRERVTAAINAAADNPLIFVNEADGSAFKVTGGNFHGQGPALWLDTLSVALAAVGNIAERRLFRLTTPDLSVGLPAMLVPEPGLDSGLMMPQYTAAALVSDNKTLAHPDSVDSIPSSANQEDHVSMGANAARHALEVVDNVRNILAIELLTAAQAVDLRPDGPARLGEGTRLVYDLVRQRAAYLEHDRELAPDMDALAGLIRSGAILAALDGALGAGWL